MSSVTLNDFAAKHWTHCQRRGKVPRTNPPKQVGLSEIRAAS
jgi:hypothetical protein